MEAIDPKDRERVCAEWQAAAEGQREFSSEYRFRKPDGKVSWVMGRAKPIQDDSGAVVRYLGTLLDITERKRAEQLGVLEDVFRVAPSFLHVLRGPDFVFEFANEAYYRLVGQRDLIGRPAFEAMPEAAEGGYPERIARVMETGEAFFGRELSVTLMRTPGAEPEQRIIDLVYLPLKDAEGTCTGVLGHGTDVTEHVRDRKRAEEAMRQKAEELQGVLDTAPVAVWIAQDRECRVITGNAYADELVMGTARGGNISRSAAPGKAAVNYRVFQEGVELRPEDLPAQRAAATCRPVSAFEMELVFPDGRSLNLLAGAVPLFDGQGNVRGAIVAGLDVTSLKKAQEALRESERRFRLMADGTPLIIWVSDANGDNQYVNRAYREFFGLTAAEAEGQGWQPLVHPEDRAGYVEAISTATREHKTLRAQIRVRRHDGAWRWIESYAEPRFSASGEFLGMAGSCPDITEQKAFQTELERLVAERTARLQELVGELEHFSFTITHDLKSPLRAMRGFADLAGAMCAEGEQGQAREYLGRIARAAERMDRLIADALSYSKSVRQELTLEDVDAGALLRGMLDTYPELQPEKARIRVEGRLPVVQANESGLTQVFSNLLGNAVKFAKRGEIAEIRVWAEEGKSDGSGGESRSEKPGSGRVRIWVEDKGIGIAKEMLPRVFDMFARASKDYEGTGIGLALVRKVAQRMGGKVGVESEEGKGSRFFIELKRGEGQAWPG